MTTSRGLSFKDGDTPIVIVAAFVPQSGKEHELRRALQAVLQPTREEPGCLRFDLLVSETPTTTFRFFEIFATQDAIDAHRQTEHYRVYRAAAMPLLQAPPEVVVMSPVDVAGLSA